MPRGDAGQKLKEATRSKENFVRQKCLSPLNASGRIQGEREGKDAGKWDDEWCPNEWQRGWILN